MSPAPEVKTFLCHQCIIGADHRRTAPMTTEESSLRGGMRCPSCGRLDAQARRFCGECGFDLQNAAPSAERRSITVMFCDVVGSTALSEKLDPEELGELILGYREIVAAAIARYGGFVARFVGDGVLAYFGYPRAHDDDPVRALHAGLETLQRMADWNRELEAARGVRLPVRIGVHTGLVVVGELARGGARETAGALGETPNLAARIMDLAPKDGLLVSGVTQALAARHFNWRDGGERPIDGLSRPVRVFQPLDAQAADGPASTSMQVMPLANRAHELEFLQQRWRECLGGRGQAVAILGEPGIGKTRLIRAFADSLDATRHRKVVLQCSQYFANTAFHPVIEFFRRRLARSETPALEQLAAAIAAFGMDPAEGVPLLASLLGVPLAAPYRALQATARVQRDSMMAFLHEWLLRAAAQRPMLLVIEDLQWADASTLELVSSLLEKLAGRPILIAAAFRVQERDPWKGRREVSRLHIERLTTPHVLELIGHVTAGRSLPSQIVEEVVRRTDGVPLFIEELTKAVIERPPAAAEVEASASEPDIPISLHATLMARLDSIQSAKRVAQRASVLGREFSYELISATSELGADEVERGLSQLVQAQLLFQFGTPPRSTYLFKHSMIQETAYRSLLRAQRREYHLRIAEALVQRFPETCSGQPELVAHHYSNGHRPLQAAGFWRRAGEQALARSANVEAYAHLRSGLDALATCSASQTRLQEEVQLLVAFGSALSALKGSAAPEVEQTYARARELCRDLDDPRYLFPVLRGLHSFYVVRGPLGTACSMIEQLRDMATDARDTVQLVEADRRLGWCRFCMGDIPSARTSLRAALDLYDRSQSFRHIITVGSDPGVIGLVNLAWLEGLAGRPLQAVAYSNQAIRLARDISYDLGLAYAVGMSAALHQSLGDAQRTAELARETIELAQARGFAYWEAWATGLLGWATAALGEVDVGIELLEKGLSIYRGTGSELFGAHMEGLLAEVNRLAGRHDRALQWCEQALASAERTEAHFFDAEVHRIEGQCLLERDRRTDSARACFEDAIARARAQGANMLELRAALALARLEEQAGARSEGTRLLEAALARFDGETACVEYLQAKEWACVRLAD